MTMTDRDPASTRLEALLDAARAQEPTLPDGLRARMLADAEALRPNTQTRPETRPETGPETGPRTQPRPRAAAPGLWTQLGGLLGGWPGLGGLATACAAGLWLGLAPPAMMPDPVDLVLGQAEVDPMLPAVVAGLWAEEG